MLTLIQLGKAVNLKMGQLRQKVQHRKREWEKEHIRRHEQEVQDFYMEKAQYEYHASKKKKKKKKKEKGGDDTASYTDGLDTQYLGDEDDEDNNGPYDREPELYIPPFPLQVSIESRIEVFHDFITELLFCIGNAIDLWPVGSQAFRDRKKFDSVTVMRSTHKAVSGGGPVDPTSKWVLGEDGKVKELKDASEVLAALGEAEPSDGAKGVTSAHLQALEEEEQEIEQAKKDLYFMQTCSSKDFVDKIIKVQGPRFKDALVRAAEEQNEEAELKRKEEQAATWAARKGKFGESAEGEGGGSDDGHHARRQPLAPELADVDLQVMEMVRTRSSNDAKALER